MIANWLGDGAARCAGRVRGKKASATFATPAEAIEGFMYLVRHARAQEELMRTPPSLPTDLKVDKAKADVTIKTAIAAGRSVLRKWKPSSFSSPTVSPTVPTAIARDPAEVGAFGGRLHREARRLRGEDPFRRHQP